VHAAVQRLPAAPMVMQALPTPPQSALAPHVWQKFFCAAYG